MLRFFPPGVYWVYWLAVNASLQTLSQDFSSWYFFSLDSQKNLDILSPRPPLMALFLRISCVFFKTVWRSQKKEGWLAQKVPVKKIYYPWKFSDFCPWKRFFARAKNQKLAREKKIRAWKKLKKSKNTGVKNAFCPWKKRKRAKKRLSRPLFFSRPKKKNTAKGYPTFA